MKFNFVAGDTVEVAKEIYQRWNGIMDKLERLFNTNTAKKILKRPREKINVDEFTWKSYISPTVILI